MSNLLYDVISLVHHIPLMLLTSFTSLLLAVNFPALGIWPGQCCCLCGFRLYGACGASFVVSGGAGSRGALPVR